jgi:hypothetical protein
MLQLKCSLFAADRQFDGNPTMLTPPQFNALGMIGFINLPLSGNS